MIYPRNASPIIILLLACVTAPTLASNAASHPHHVTSSNNNLRGKKKERNLQIPTNDPGANCAIYPCDTYYCPESLRPLWCDSISIEDNDSESEDVRVPELELELEPEPETESNTEETTQEDSQADPCDLTELGFEFYAKKTPPPTEMVQLDEDALVVVAKSGSDSTVVKSPEVADFATECLTTLTCSGFYTDPRLKAVVSETMVDATAEYEGVCSGLYMRKSDN